MTSDGHDTSPERRDPAPDGSTDEPPRDPEETEEQRERRRRLVRRHIATTDVEDPRVVHAMRRVPRHRFVPPPHADRAYEDRPFPIGGGQVITQPSLVARMVDAAEIGPDDRVLEVGTGSGYGAAVLAELAREVYSVERRESFAESARRRLGELGYDGVRIRVGDGSLGWKDAAPFDAVVCTAGSSGVPDPLLAQLRPLRWLVIPLGSRPREQTLYRVRRVTGGEREREPLGPVRFVPLVGAGGWAPEEV